MDAKRAGDVVFVLGTTHADLGASHYLAQLGAAGGAVPRLRDPAGTIASYRWLHRAIRSGLVSSCHDLSDGGLGVALAETAFAGDLGLVVDLREVPSERIDRDDVLLFSETPGRLLITVPAGSARAFEILVGAAARRIGVVSEDRRLMITGLAGENVIDADIAELKDAWKRPLSFEEVR
jgi:phosphoribosylformylglycinamidine synthase